MTGFTLAMAAVTSTWAAIAAVAVDQDNPDGGLIFALLAIAYGLLANAGRTPR